MIYRCYIANAHLRYVLLNLTRKHLLKASLFSFKRTPLRTKKHSRKRSLSFSLSTNTIKTSKRVHTSASYVSNGWTILKVLLYSEIYSCYNVVLRALPLLKCYLTLLSVSRLQTTEPCLQRSLWERDSPPSSASIHTVIFILMRLSHKLTRQMKLCACLCLCVRLNSASQSKQGCWHPWNVFLARLHSSQSSANKRFGRGGFWEWKPALTHLTLADSVGPAEKGKRRRRKRGIGG